MRPDDVVSGLEPKRFDSEGGRTYLETVIDKPLESGQSTDHADSDGQTVPETSEADVAVDSGHGFAAAFARWGFYHVSLYSRRRRHFFE